MWQGLTMEEAKSLCLERGLLFRFDVTMDPKAAAAMSAQEYAQKASAAPKVIRAREEGGAMCFLLGYFAEAGGSSTR